MVSRQTRCRKSAHKKFIPLHPDPTFPQKRLLETLRGQNSFGQADLGQRHTIAYKEKDIFWCPEFDNVVVVHDNFLPLRAGWQAKNRDKSHNQNNDPNGKLILEHLFGFVR